MRGRGDRMIDASTPFSILSHLADEAADPGHPRVVFLGKLRLVFVHEFGAVFIDHARQVGHPDVLARDAQLDQEAQTSQRRSPCA